MNKEEIRFNTKSLIETWLERNKSAITDKSVFGFACPSTETTVEKDKLDEFLFNKIEEGYKGQIVFFIDHKSSEIFDIN